MLTLYEQDLGTDRVGRIKNLLAAYPYLLRHHIRSGCLCHKEDSAIEDKYRLVLQDPSTQVVDARYEGDKASGGAYQPPAVSQTRTCWVDRRDLPWSLLDQDNSQYGRGSGASTLLKVAQSQNRPLWVCDRLGREIMDVAYNPNYTSRERLTLLGSIDKLTNAIGECERIHQTAVPLNYARHSLRSLTIWLFTLPFALVKDLGLLTGPATAITAWVLFGVYQIGHSIEDPFQGSLRLSMLCDAIRRDILGDNHVNVGHRASAFALEQENDEDDLWDNDVTTPPFLFPTSVKKQKDLETILSSKLVQENGTWTFVGA
jgi:Bestrophin, RFP-TM, chloride channel